MCWFLAAHFVDVAGPWIRQPHGRTPRTRVLPVTSGFNGPGRGPGGQPLASPVATEPWRPCNAAHPDDCACPVLWLHSSYTVKASDTSVHMHTRGVVMIPRLAAALFVDVESQIFRSHGWNTSNVGSSCAVSLHRLMWDAAGIGRHRRRIDGRRRKRVCRRPGGAGWRRTLGEVVRKNRLSERYRCHNAGPRFSLWALTSCSMGSRNRLVGFSQCRHPPLPRSRESAPAEHLLQRLPAGISRDAYAGSRDLLGSVLSGRSDGTFGREDAVAPQPIRRSCSLHGRSPRRGCRLVLQSLAAASLLSAERGVVPWTVLGKRNLGWTKEQRAPAEFADAAYFPEWEIRRQAVPGTAVMPQSARRWNGLLPPWEVLFCSPGSLTTVSAATCGPKLALPHNDSFDGRHFCGAKSYMAATRGYACQHVPQVCQLIAAGLDSLSVEENREPYFSFRSFLSNDIFQRISREFGERDKSSWCFFFFEPYFILMSKRKASWTRRLGGTRQRAHHSGSGNEGRTTTQPIVL